MVASRSSGRKASAARLSVASNTLLVTLKLIVGLMIGSVAIVSEAIHSGIDLIASVIAFYSVRVSDVPADDDHPYGHGKIESISGTVEALLIFVAGGWIIYEAVLAILDNHKVTTPMWGLAVMGVSALVNSYIARRLFIVAEEEDSVALRADAHHLSVDVYTSIGVFVGLGLVHFTGLSILDPVIALCVGLLILHTAFRITLEACQPLLDAALPSDEIQTIINTLKADKRVLGWHKLRTRKSGSARHVDLHLQLDDNLTLLDSHAISHDVKDAIKSALPNAYVFIHTEPYEEEARRHVKEI